MLQAVDMVRPSCFPHVSSRPVSAIIGSSEQREVMLEFSVALNTFCSTVLSLDSVKKVGIKGRGESFSVWTYVTNPTDDILMKIFTAELVFRNSIPGQIFDFAVKYEDTAAVPSDFYVFQGR